MADDTESTESTPQIEDQISAECVKYWGAWLVEFQRKLAPLARMNGISPEAFFLGMMMNRVRGELEELTSTLRTINDDSEPWQKD